MAVDRQAFGDGEQWSNLEVSTSAGGSGLSKLGRALLVR
jgi:hypothetical protein